MSDKPTILLVHGAFADTSSWDPVTRLLQAEGHTVIAAPNPLRGLTHDSAYTQSVLATIPGPVVLAGHSYGGAVITNAATGADNAKALVFITAFAPEQGETVGELNDKYPSVALDITTPRPFPTPRGQADPGPDDTPNLELLINPEAYHQGFAPDTDAETAAVLAASQRPWALAAVTERSGPPAWRTLPNYYAVATNDHMINPELQRFMAQRINATTIEIEAGHHAAIAQPRHIADLIITAAT